MTEWSYLSSAWLSLLGRLQWSDHWVFIVGTTIINFVLFWAHNGLLFCLYKNNFMTHYQIQPSAKVDEHLVWENIRETIINQLIGVPIAAYILYYPFTYFGMQVYAPLPQWTTILRDLLIAAAVTDTMGYWGHRTLHHKAIYKYVHKHHHRYKVNVGIAAVFAHPIEDIVNNTFSSVSGCMLLGSHVLVFWLWLAIRQTEAINAHSGYQFLPDAISKWCSGGRFHEYHHSHNVGNYGALTTIWDYLMGTDASYLEYEAKRLAEASDANKKKKL